MVEFSFFDHESLSENDVDLPGRNRVRGNRRAFVFPNCSPKRSRGRAAIAIRASYPAVGVVVLSQYAEPGFVLDLFERGSEHLGYLLKERIGDPGELGRAVRAVAGGDSVVDPD